MYVKVNNPNQADAGNIVTKCPICGNGGTFDKLPCNDLIVGRAPLDTYYFGQRRCPNKDCNAHIFFVRFKNDNLITYPSLKIDFNAANIPDPIKATFEEAITCHAEECYVASAIMIRRTLEELCENKQCQGGNLKQRIDALKSSVVLPVELFEALDELRIL